MEGAGNYTRTQRNRVNRRKLRSLSRTCSFLIEENARNKRALALLDNECKAMGTRLYEERARDLVRTHMQVKWQCSHPANMAPRLLSFDTTPHYAPSMTAAYTDLRLRPFFVDLHNAIHHMTEYPQFEELEVDSFGSFDSVASNTSVEFNSPFKLERDVQHRNLLCLATSAIDSTNVSVQDVAKWLEMFENSKDLKFHTDWMKLHKENITEFGWLGKLEELFTRLFKLETLLGVFSIRHSQGESPDVPLSETVVLLVCPEPPLKEVLALLLENQRLKRVFERLSILFKNGRFETLLLPK